VHRPTFSTTDNLLLAGHRRLTGSEPRAAVVIAHGFSASAEDPAVAATALALTDAGFDVVTYDARGHGGSEGESTLGDLEQHDVAAAVHAARERSDRLVVVGASMGAIAVLRYAANHGTAVDGVVAVSCPARWELPRTPTAFLCAALTRTRPGRALAARWLRVRIAPEWTDPEPPISLVPRIASPVAVVHGRRDRFIPPTAGADLFEVANEPRRLSVVEGMGHAFDDAATPAILESIEWTLSSAQQRQQPLAATSE